MVRANDDSNTSRVFQFIVDHKSENDGIPPSIREIQDRLNLSSTSVVTYHLRRLEKEGVIKRYGEHYTSRAIMVVGGKWTYGEND